MRFLKIDTSGKQARKRIKEIAEVQGKRYAEYYYYIINGAKWTYGLTVLVLFALLGAMGNSGIALFFGLVLSILLMWYVDETMNDQLEQRRDDLLTDLPQMLSKLTLLVNSGMVMRDAWVKVAEGEDRILYQEMRITAQEMKNGVSDYEAYRNFADRCSIKEIRRFSTEEPLTDVTESVHYIKKCRTPVWRLTMESWKQMHIAISQIVAV